jgi:hypothetical protein
LPYIALLAVASALAVGELKIDDTGAGASHNMIVGGGAAALLVALAAARDHYWRDSAVAAAAVGLVAVSGLNPSAMSTTKWGAFGAAAGIAVIASAIARRPSTSGSEHRMRGWLQRGSHDVGDVAHQPNI